MPTTRSTTKMGSETSSFIRKIFYLVNEAWNTMDFKSRLKEAYYMEVSVRHIKKNLRYSLKILIILWYGSMAFNTLLGPSGFLSFIVSLLCLIFLIFCYFITIYMKNVEQVQSWTLVTILILLTGNVIDLYNSFALPEINYTPTIQICLLMFSNLFLTFHISVTFWVVSYGMLLMSIIINVRYKGLITNHTNVMPYASVFSLDRMPMFDKNVNLERYFVGVVLLGCGITFMSMYIFFVNNIRRRAAFLRLGYNVQTKHQIKNTMKTQMRWIDAIMPEVIKNEYVEHNEEIKLDKYVFVKNFDNVSILFADIVGFTKMCSKKLASEIVTLLNDLFNRFDQLCDLTNCEKLGTLGDCYYCVAGCPLPRPDHAISCIEMGLGMCRIIKQFNKDYKEDVNMRVGVHTGRVNAAVIGKDRFRFDVYSNDVIIANKMESSGKPGFVHISQTVYEHVRLMYKVQNGEDLEIKIEKEQGIAGTLLQSTFIKTYFIDPVSPQLQYNEKIFERTDNLTVISKESKESEMESDTKTEFDQDISSSKSHAKHVEDTKFIESLKFDPDRQIQFFIYPPLNIFSLMFIDKEIEWNFNTFILNDTKKLTFDSMKLTPLFDCLSCLIYSIILYIALFIMFPDIMWKGKLIILVNILTSVLLSIVNIWQSYRPDYKDTSTFDFFTHILICHPVIRALICFYFLSTPLIIIITLLNDCTKIYIDYTFTTRYFTIILFSLFILPLFLSTHYLIKIFICCFNVTVSILVMTWKPCSRVNLTYTFAHYSCMGQYNITDLTFFKKVQYNFIFQICVTFLLLVLVIRELEMNIRLLFYVRREAEIRKEEAAEAMRNAEQLLYNIIPKYVFDQLVRKTMDLLTLENLNYAVSIPKVGVVFACISNFFSKYYREDYKGGENALRLLHKIICYFDDMLKKDKYKDVEKIKTINDCYMVASGLNFKLLDRNFKDGHLFALMNYAFDLIKALNYFNDNYIIGTDKFQIKIGYNFGPVTAGIIGATKPMYDIWGDTVNVASRMYSTGFPGCIQVPDYVVGEMESAFDFTYRGQISVKGKGSMNTYICVGPRTGLKTYVEIKSPVLSSVQHKTSQISNTSFDLKLYEDTITIEKEDNLEDVSVSKLNPKLQYKKRRIPTPNEVNQYKLFVKKSRRQ